MALCKKCKKEIKFKVFPETVGRFIQANIDGTPHDYIQCEKDRCKRFMELGTKHSEVKKFTNAYGTQEVTFEWYELDGEKLETYVGPYLASPH